MGSIILLNCRWGKIRSIPYIPDFGVIKRELDAKLKEER